MPLPLYLDQQVARRRSASRPSLEPDAPATEHTIGDDFGHDGIRDVDGVQLGAGGGERRHGLCRHVGDGDRHGGRLRLNQTPEVIGRVPTGQIVIEATLPPARFVLRQPQTHDIALNGRRGDPGLRLGRDEEAPTSTFFTPSVIRIGAGGTSILLCWRSASRT
jgi:hypothetical protein